MQKPICVVCNKRVARFLREHQDAPYKVCKPCNTLLRAEKSWEKHGLRRPHIQWLSDNEFIKAYNRWAAKGLLLPEIAVKLGMAEQSLKNRKTKLAQNGAAVVKPFGQAKHLLQPSEPVDRSQMTAKANEHGQGTGITGCNCLPCLTARREYRTRWQRNNRDKVKGYRVAVEEKRKAKRAAARKDKPS